MSNTYAPKYLKIEPVRVTQDTALAMVARNRSRIVDAELEAMVRRNPNRRATGDKMEAVPTEAPVMRQDVSFIVTAILAAASVLLVALAAFL